MQFPNADLKPTYLWHLLFVQSCKRSEINMIDESNSYTIRDLARGNGYSNCHGMKIHYVFKNLIYAWE